MAQRADIALTAGASSVSDAHMAFACPFGVPCLLVPPETIKTEHQVFLEGTVGFRLVKTKAASIHLEVPIAGIPNQTVRFTSSTVLSTARLSSFYITPSIKTKFLPDAPISPWISLGGGLAHFSFPDDPTNKIALQLGGGADIKTPFPRFGLRLEVRDFLSGHPSFGTPGIPLAGSAEGGLSRHNVLAGGGLVIHF